MYIHIYVYIHIIYIIHLFPVERLALNLYFIPLRAALVSTPGIFLPSAFRPRGLDVLNASTLQMRSLTGLVALRFHQLQLGFHLIAVEIWDQSRKKWTWICQKASWILSGYPRYPQVLVIKYTGFWGYGSLFSEEPDWWMRESPWWPHGRHHHKLCLACEELPIQKHLLKSVQTRVHGGCTPMNCDVSIQRFNRGSPGGQVGNPDGTASMVYYRNIICWKDDLHWALWHGRVWRVRRVLEWSALGEGTSSHVATLSHMLVSLTWHKPTKNQLWETTKSTQSTECL